MNPLTTAARWVLATVGQALDDLAEQEPVFLGMPERSYVTLNPPAWDDCCEGGGQLTVLLGQAYPAGTPFPSPDQRPQNCGATYALPMTVELVRCAPTPDNDGTVPLAALTEANERLFDEAWASMRAVQCAFGGAYDGLVGGLTPAGEHGGCHGFLLNVTLHVVRFPSLS